jgi:hypothetical protein
MANFLRLKLGVFCLGVAACGGVYGQPSPKIVAVEEDWEVVLATPDPWKASPQFVTYMSPTDSLDGQHFSVDWNHVQRPDGAAGGFRTKALRGDELMMGRFSPIGRNLDHDGETIRWTQRMMLENGLLSFDIVEGTSRSWGAFGGEGVRVTFPAPALSDLNRYSPHSSVGWSGIGYAANRIQHFTLANVRLFMDDGQIFSLAVQSQAE